MPLLQDASSCSCAGTRHLSAVLEVVRRIGQRWVEPAGIYLHHRAGEPVVVLTRVRSLLPPEPHERREVLRRKAGRGRRTLSSIAPVGPEADPCEDAAYGGTDQARQEVHIGSSAIGLNALTEVRRTGTYRPRASRACGAT